MQPAVTETEVNFTQPSGYNIQVAPENIPPIFIRERTIIYGIINRNSTSGEESPKEGVVCLSGDLLGEKIQHYMKFQLMDPVARENGQVSTVHHLAGKRLIKEMELGDTRFDQRDEIVKLSCDSGVISFLTAFIAIDVDQKEPVRGNMERWDIQSPGMELEAVCSGYLALSGLMLDDLEDLIDRAETDVKCASMRLDVISAKRSKSLFSRSRRSKSSVGGKKAVKCTPGIFSRLFRKSKSNKKEEAPVEKDLGESASLPGINQQSEATVGKLEVLIGLQLASGAWRLTAELAAVLNKTTEFIEKSCPVPCEGDVESIWATILALCYMEQKQSGLKEEWELVAAKAEAWLAKQSLPEDCSIQDLREKTCKIVD